MAIEEAQRIREIEKHFNQILLLVGFDNSESATENFTAMMSGAIDEAAFEMYRSAKQGLCMDCVRVMASYLITSPAAKKELKAWMRRISPSRRKELKKK